MVSKLSELGKTLLKDEHLRRPDRPKELRKEVARRACALLGRSLRSSLIHVVSMTLSMIVDVTLLGWRAACATAPCVQLSADQLSAVAQSGASGRTCDWARCVSTSSDSRWHTRIRRIPVVMKISGTTRLLSS